MKPAILALTLTALFPAAAADAPAPFATLSIWPKGKMPGTAARETEAVKPSTDGVLRITNVSEPTLSVYKAPDSKQRTPAVIICPGGGYGYVVMSKEGTDIAAWLNSLGITGIVLKYRTPNNRNGAMQDLQRALRLTRIHAAEWNINDSQLGIMGFSAGGHLCARMATNWTTSSYEAIDEVDAASSKPNFVGLVYPAYLGKEGKVASELPLSESVPPTFVTQTEDDKGFYAGTRLFADALAKSGAGHESAFFATGGHGYGLRCQQEAKVWPQRFQEWLKNLLELKR